jgi:tetratricopeptide (TPR) repeat protein
VYVGLFSGGCARWSSPQAGHYVTVEADANEDTEKARRIYRDCRKEMEKRARGEKCDLADIEKRLRDTLAADVRFGPAHHSLGIVYTWQKKLYLAAWEFDYAARLMPDRFEPLNNLGLVYESVGKYDQAKSYYLQACEKSPNNPDVIGNLARASFRSGQSVNEMRPLLEDVLAMDPRPEWRHWATELLGTNPKPIDDKAGDRFESRLSTSPQEPASIEELPLLSPPPPDAALPAFEPDTHFELPQESEILSPPPDSFR